MKLRRVGSRSFVLAALAAFAAPAVAAIVTLGDVLPSPVTPVVAGALNIGNSGVGQVQVNAGSTVQADRLLLGSGRTGDGTLLIGDAGSAMTILWDPVTRFAVDLGGQGIGRISLLGGGVLNYGVGSGCGNGCRMLISNGAGSTGELIASGAGSSFNSPGFVVVGQASLFTTAADGFDYGTPGGHSDGRVQVIGGATVATGPLLIASRGGGLGRTDAESVSGSVLVSGAGSRWDITRTDTVAAARSIIFMSSNDPARPVNDAVSSLRVDSGGVIRLDGSVTPTQFTGLNMGFGGGVGSRSTTVVDGAGSLMEFTGGMGFFNVGGAGSLADATVSGGGRVRGIGDAGLLSSNIGREGSTASLTVIGHDATGAESRFSVAGRNPVTGGGSFLGIGRAASNGTASVLAGGRVDVDSSAVTLAVPDMLSALYVGEGVGGMGSLTISGRNAVSGVPSTVAVTGGVGLNPYTAVGRDGGTGNLMISDGGRLVMQGNFVSTSVTPGSGERLFLEIGDRFGAGTAVSTGTVTVTGAGSLLALTGAADRFISVGNNLNTVGTLNVTAGGRVESLIVLVGTGTGANGVLNMNGGSMLLSGILSGGTTAGTGAGMGVGNGTSTGLAQLAGASVIEVSSTAPRAGVFMGGVSTVLGGNGTIDVTEGSRLTVSSPEALVYVGNNGTAAVPGIGTLNVRGPGSLVEAVGTGARILVGRNAFTTGTIDVGAGAQIRSTDLIGIAHDGTASTLGTGTLCVDGTATAPRIINGANGLICGSGTLVGDVTNLGTLSPGRSPSRIRIEGIFDTRGGRIILEVERVAGGGVGIVGGAIHIGGSEFHVDEIVITDFDLATFGDVEIVFSFLGLTSPEEFEASGEWNLATFFLEGDGAGGVKPIDDADLDKFNEAIFSARADSYEFTSFSFTPRGGPEFTVSFIPVPPTWLLMLPALVAVALRRRR